MNEMGKLVAIDTRLYDMGGDGLYILAVNGTLGMDRTGSVREETAFDGAGTKPLTRASIITHRIFYSQEHTNQTASPQSRTHQ
jgi:hypothetical protein